MDATQLQTAVQEVVNYNWTDELADFREQIEMGEETGMHVFRHLVALQNWVDGTEETPEQAAGIQEEL